MRNFITNANRANAIMDSHINNGFYFGEPVATKWFSVAALKESDIQGVYQLICDECEKPMRADEAHILGNADFCRACGDPTENIFAEEN